MTSRRQLLFGDFSGRRVDLAQQSGARIIVRFGEDCLPAQGVLCRSCGEVCESGAILFTPVSGGTSRPFLQNSLCTGCGECLPICPVLAISLVVDATTGSAALLQENIK